MPRPQLDLPPGVEGVARSPLANPAAAPVVAPPTPIAGLSLLDRAAALFRSAVPPTPVNSTSSLEAGLNALEARSSPQFAAGNGNNGVPTVGAIRASGRSPEQVLNPPPLPIPPTTTPPPKPAAQSFMDRSAALAERAQAGMAKLIPTQPGNPAPEQPVAPQPVDTSGQVYQQLLNRK